MSQENSLVLTAFVGTILHLLRAKVFIPKGLLGDLWLHSRHAGSWSGPPHRHEVLEFNLVTRGAAIGLARNQRVSLEPGVINWLFPAQEHFFVDNTPDYDMWVVVFRQTLVRETAEAHSAALRQRDPSGNLSAMLPPGDRHRLQALLLSLSAVADRPEHFNHGLRWLLLEAWRLTQAAETAAPLPRLDVHPAVERASRLIRSNPAQAELDDLAERCDVSAPWLSRLFHRQLGVTLTAYRARQRLARLQQLAAAQPGERNLTYLALEAGFGSYTQCYRAAIALTGQTPKALIATTPQRD